MNQDVEKLLYRPSEVAEAMGYSRSKTYMLIASGVIPSIKIGKSVRVPVVALRNWIEQQLKEQSQLQEDGA